MLTFRTHCGTVSLLSMKHRYSARDCSGVDALECLIEELIEIFFALLYSTAIPVIIVPEVETQCISSGQTSIPVTWDEVTATNTDGQAIYCTSDSGANVTVTGGDFPAGSHTVVCCVTNNWGCFASANFTFDVVGKTSSEFFKLPDHEVFTTSC